MRVLAGLIACAAAVAAVHAGQQQPPPRFADRVDVSNVVIDVRVVDEMGAPVLGLTAADFAVTIGGKAAPVQSSIWTGAVAPVVSHPSGSLAPLPAEAAAEPGQLVVLLFQKSLTRERARGFMRMTEQSRALVRGLPPSARIAVLMFESRLKMWSDFTSDREAIDRILAHGLLYEKAPQSVPAGVPSLLDAVAPGRKRASTMEQAFERIGRALGPLPGSKAIAYVGHGFGTTQFGARTDGGPARTSFGASADDLASEGDMNHEYRRAWRALTESRTSVFSLDTTNADVHTLATGMQIISEATGGFYAHSLDFPEKPMRFVAGALTGHYVLFVEPPADAGNHAIEVGVATQRHVYVYSTSSFKALER